MTPVSSDGKGSPDSEDKDDNTCNVGHYMYEDPSDPDGKRTKQPDSAMRECIDEDPSATKEFHDHEEKRVLPEFLQGTVLSGSFYRNLAEDYLLPRKHKGSDKNFDYCMVLPANEDGTGWNGEQAITLPSAYDGDDLALVVVHEWRQVEADCCGTPDDEDGNNGLLPGFLAPLGLTALGAAALARRE